ncbi:unnamed protein product [Lathyrus oleraceus]
MSLERHETETADTETKNTLSYGADESKLNVEEKQESYSKLEESGSEKLGLGEATQEGVVDQQKKTAIIHDFCLGIPFGLVSLPNLITCLLDDLTVMLKNELSNMPLIFI